MVFWGHGSVGFRVVVTSIHMVLLMSTGLHRCVVPREWHRVWSVHGVGFAAFLSGDHVTSRFVFVHGFWLILLMAWTRAQAAGHRSCTRGAGNRSCSRERSGGAADTQSMCPCIDCVFLFCAGGACNAHCDCGSRDP